MYISLKKRNRFVDHEIKNNSNWPYITPLVIGLHVEDFRGAVHGSSNIKWVASVAVGIHKFDKFRTPEVGYLYYLATQKYVFRFDIAM